jgi:hypothetical protein
VDEGDLQIFNTEWMKFVIHFVNGVDHHRECHFPVMFYGNSTLTIFAESWKPSYRQHLSALKYRDLFQISPEF